uniref:Pre-mRNA-processing factor 39 n=1 Tax=Rhizophora mucronata TaxID=61149 RepID=A0A2P2L1A7_RHIMU
MLRLCTPDKAVEVFERAVKSATYSVDMWVDYCSFASSTFKDPSDIRRLFKRGLSFVGNDYLCHALWDKYIAFEFSKQHWGSLAHIYIQTLRFPTKKLHHYYDSFKKLVGIWEKEIETHSSSAPEVLEPVLESEVAACYKRENVSCIIKDLLDLSFGVAKFQALKKYKYIGEKLYQEGSELNDKINCFEAHIRRPYFHVKPLDVSQLENWHHYLDFAETHGDFVWAVKLYERCLIPCANYPEFWMRYVEFMESKGGREIANFALDRATRTFLKRNPNVHLFNAMFKEHTKDVVNARAAFHQCNAESDPEFLNCIIRKANMERRLGNFIAASNIYREAIEITATKEKWHTLPVLYIQFSRLKFVTTDSEDAAIDILRDGIKHVPCCKLLIEELITFAMMHGGSKHRNMVNSIVADAISPVLSESQGLSAEMREDISRLYLEFVDFCGTVGDLRRAWSQHVRLFPHSIRTAFFDPPTSPKRWKLAMKRQERPHSTSPPQSSGDHSSDCLPSSLLQDEKLCSPESNDTQTVNPAFDHMSENDPPLLETSDVQSEQVSDHKSQIQENHNMLYDQTRVDLLQSGEYEENVQESLHEVPLEVLKPVREDSPEQNISLDSAYRAPNETESAQALLESSKENDVQQEYDHGSGQDFKPPSMEGLSLNPQETKSPGKITATSYKSVAPQGISLFRFTSSECETPPKTNESSGGPLKNEPAQENIMSSRSMPDSDEDANINSLVSSPISIQPAVSVPSNNRNAGSPSPPSNQEIMTQGHSRQQMHASGGKNWRQRSDSERFRRDFRFHGPSHKRLHQQQQASLQHPQSEIDSQMPMSQGYPSQTFSSGNLQLQQGSQRKIQSPASNPQARSMQNMQQQHLSLLCQSPSPVQPAAYPQTQMSTNLMQSNEQHGNAQNNQAYNQMWQYCYYQQQQQQLLWQQQQLQQQLSQQQLPQQQQLLQQQYQQVLLQLQYLQQQQQQLYCHPQQMQQPQEQQLQLQQKHLLMQQPQLQLQQQQVFQQLQQQQLQQQYLLYLQQQWQPQQHQQPMLQLQQQQGYQQQQAAVPQQQQIEQEHGQSERPVTKSHIQV